ncbi:MAG: hypothetical protein LUC89_07850 [Oscillospiraceae bacterium]|nr:hypothetical protein [Oscillospiraceae bacterium]
MKKILAFVLMAAILVCPVFASGEASAEAEAAETTTAATSTTETTLVPTESATTIAAAAAEEAEEVEEVEEAPAHDHSFVIVEIVDATCAEAGTVTMECAECGLTYTYDLPATGEHSYIASTKEATCTEEGLITYTCSVCGDTYSEVIPTTEHTPSAEEATCTEAVVCTVCGEELIPAVGHSYTYQYDAVIAEDGTYESYGTWVCDNCGDTLNATEGNAIYYYGLLEGDDTASDEASDEAEAETVEISDPNNSLWYTIAIIMVVILVAELAIIMLSFGKKKKD